MKSTNMIGFKTGKLKVTERAGSRGGKALWKCQCECGGFCFHTTSELNAGKLQSCGCVQKAAASELAVLAGRKRTFEAGSCLNSYEAILYKNNSSGVKGVSWYKKSGKWRVQIKYARENYYLGLYDELKDAVSVRKEAENFIKENFNSPEKITEYLKRH